MNPYDVLFDSSESDFGGMFNQWRFFRVKKIEQFFDKEWFRGKKILELGCGYGNVGHYFSLLGSDVTFSDARKEALDIVKKKNSKFKTIQINQETKWSIDDHFDLIIHLGISYNLNYWEQDLIRTIKHADNIAYETAVTKYDSDAEYKILNYKYTSKMHGPFGHIGSLVSSSNIETLLKENNAEYTRCDDPDLNTMQHKYDWKEVEFNADDRNGVVESWWNNTHFGGRRYWIIKCSK
jgi:SAM-dependent methyltransferase